MVRADLAGSVAMSVPRPKHSYMALFKLGTSRKCQICCPWTEYFLGFWGGYFWLNKINFTFTTIPSILRVQCKSGGSIANPDNSTNSINSPRNPKTTVIWLFICQQRFLCFSISGTGVPGAPFAALPTPWQGSWMFAEVEADGNSGQKSSGRCNDRMALGFPLVVIKLIL